MEKQRFEKQIAFLIEIDKLKNIFRRTYLINQERHENDAEHSWHLALFVLILSEYANDKDLDIARVIEMVVLHDLVEIYAGDTYVYDQEGRKSQQKREAEAAEKLFSLLPEDQKQHFASIIEEHNAQETNEARFANTVDRLQPLMHNFFTDGKAWREHGIKKEQVIEINKSIAEGSQELWEYGRSLIDEAYEKGWLT